MYQEGLAAHHAARDGYRVLPRSLAPFAFPERATATKNWHRAGAPKQDPGASFASEDGRCPLPGPEAIEFPTPFIAQLVAPGVNGATKVACKVVTGLPRRLVVGELAAAFEGKRRAAKREAFAAVGGKVGFHVS